MKCFFDDALLVSKTLELTLTGKECGLEERAPMCGVPHHSSEIYVKKLIEAGYKVAICEQLTDPSEGKGIVQRCYKSCYTRNAYRKQYAQRR